MAVTDSPAGTDLSVERSVLQSCRVEHVPHHPADVLLDAVRDADGLLCMHVPITRRLIASLSRCRVITRYGTGLDNIDLESAREAGIAVCGVHDYCTLEVADHTLALLLGWVRKIPQYNRFVVEKRWNERNLTTGNWGCGPVHRLAGRTLGLLGFGHIAQAVSRRATGFGLRVIAWSPHLDPTLAAAHGAERVTRDDLVREADFLSLHVPLTAETHHLVDATMFSAMKPGSVLINTARGGLVDETALVEALSSGHLAGALLDVYETSPLPPDHPLRAFDNVLLTPHVAFYSEESLHDLRRQAAEAVREHIECEGTQR